MKEKMIQAHLDVAARYAELSTARRLKVGAIIVNHDRILSIGYNGTPAGWDNNCEDELGDGTLVTKPEVHHAEENALAKLAASHESSAGASMFLTHAPCLPCSKMIAACGIKSVYYRKHYRDTSGVDHLVQRGVVVRQVPETE